MIRKFSWLIVSCICFASTTAVALGLGEVDLKSALNQPLEAKIDLLSTSGLNTDSIKTRLGSKEEFEKAGMDRPFFLTRINFITTVNSDGSMTISLTSKEPITEPFLNFLVQLDWPNGKLLREYTLLLDPPAFDDSSAYSQPQLAQPTQVISKPNKKSTNAVSGSNYGPVSSSDTLWSIAKRVRQDSTQSVHQVMMALFDANPEAFYNNNINSLKEGAVLNIPKRQVISGYHYQSSVTLVANHNKGWGEPAKPKSTSQPNSNTRTESVANVSVESAPTGGTLSLAKPMERETSANTGSSSQENSSSNTAVLNGLQSDLDASVEATEVLRQENEQLRTNLTNINDRLEKLERLLELKDQQLAAVQQIAREANQAEQLNAEQTTTNPFENIADTSLETDTKDGSINEDNDISQQNNVDDDVLNENVQTVDNIVDVEDDKTTDETVKPQAIVKPETEKENSLLDTILGEPLYYIVPLSLILLILALLFIRQRTMRGSAFQEKLVTPAVLDDEIKLDEDDIDFADIDDSFQHDDDMDIHNDSDESDPVAEADIYIAYGKYDQAETLLRTSLETDMENIDIHVKLLECLAESKDKESFEIHYASCSSLLKGKPAEETAQEMYSESWPGESLVGEEPGAELLEDEFADLEKELQALEDNDGTDEPLELDLPADDDNFTFEDTATDIPLMEPEADVAETEYTESNAVDEEAEKLDDAISSLDASTLEDDDFDLDFDAFDEADEKDTQSIQESIEASGKEEYDFDLDESFDLEDNELDDILSIEDEPSAEDGVDDLSDLEALDELPIIGELGDEKEANTTDKDTSLEESDLEIGSLDTEESDNDSLSNDFDFEDVGELDVLDLEDGADASILDSDSSETLVRPVVEGADLGGDLSSEIGAEDFDVDFDFDDSGDEFPVSEEDAVSTKLDLARAYIDMGDVDGAKDILEEVLQEASGDSLGEAKSLIESIS